MNENSWKCMFRFIAACLVGIDLSSFYHSLPNKEMTQTVGKVWNCDVSGRIEWNPKQKFSVPKLGYDVVLRNKNFRGMEELSDEHRHVIGSILFLFYSKYDISFQVHLSSTPFPISLATCFCYHLP